MTTYGYGLDKALDVATERMIDCEVLACQSVLIDGALELTEDRLGADLSWENVANLYRDVCPDCGEDVVEEDTEDADGLTWSYKCTSCDWIGDDPNSEPNEVLEWWLVTSYLADCLEARGHCTLTDGQSTWWGRCTSGQSILLDGIMQRIVAETGYGGWGR